MTSTHRWMWASLLVALVTGASVGVLADRVVSRDTVEPSRHHRSSGTVWFDCDQEEEDPTNAHMAGRKKWFERLGRELGLDESQEARIRTLFEEHGGRASEFWQRTRSEYCQMSDSLRADVRSVLSDEQIEKLEERIARRRSKRQAAERSGDPGSERP